jgi:hypothetical protein
MITLTALATRQGEKKGGVAYAGTYQYPAFEFAVEDAIVFDLKEVEIKGMVHKYTVTSMGVQKTSADPADLMAEAIAYFESEQAKEVPNEEDRIDPTLILLRLATRQCKSQAFTDCYNDLAPKVVDPAKVAKDMALALLQTGKTNPDGSLMTYEQALARVQAFM